MKTLKRNPTLAFLGIMALAACEDGTPTAPIVDELFTRDGMIELDVLASAANVAVALALADASNNVASSRGDVRAQDGRELHDRARLRFAEAQDDLARGNRRAALDKARDGRRLVARAIEATGGGRAVAAMVESLEAIASTIGEDVDSFDDPTDVASEFNRLAVSARAALARGDATRAGERAIFGDQRTHDRRSNDRRGNDRSGRDRGGDNRGSDVGPRRAQLAIELGATAVALAERLLENDVINDERSRFLATAHELLEKARAAYGDGHYGRAVHFAEAASLLVAGADALQRGVPSDALRSLDSEAGRSPMAVLVLAELHETGVPTDRAVAVLREATAQRTREDRMLDIPAEVRRLIRQGRPPSDAADQVRRGLQRGRGNGDVGPSVPPGSEPTDRASRTRTRADAEPELRAPHAVKRSVSDATASHRVRSRSVAGQISRLPPGRSPHPCCGTL